MAPQHDHRPPLAVLATTPQPRSRSFARAGALALALAATAIVFDATGAIAIAQEPASAQSPPRIAVVDLERIFLQSPPGQKLRDELKQLEEKTRAELEKHVRQMDELQRSMEGKPPEEQRVLARRREDEELAARRTRDDAQRQAAKLEADRRKEIEDQLQPVFAKIQEERDFDLILNKTPGLVVFVKDSIEITDEVLARVGSGS